MAGRWTTPRDWVTDVGLDAPDLNEQLRDNLKALIDEARVNFTADVSITGTSFVDIVSSGAITYDGDLIVIEFYAPQLQVGASGNCRVNFRDGATDLGQFCFPGANENVRGVYGRLYTQPSVGSHTFKVSAQNGASQTSTMKAGAGGAGVFVPGFIRVARVPF